jgi:hypothetical protein
VTDEKSYGYTAESLRMLETHEGQLNAVFACFGSAAQHAQFFEAALKDFLSVCNRINNEAPSMADLDTQAQPLQKKTMGELLMLFRKRVEISDDAVTSVLLAALEKRNFLMHRFFLERIEEFNTGAGRRALLVELVEAEKCLRKAGTYTRGMSEALRGTLDGTRVMDRKSEALFSIDVKGLGE